MKSAAAVVASGRFRIAQFGSKARRSPRGDRKGRPVAAIESFSYGDHPSQLIHVWQPAAAENAPFPVAVLLHGGWWRDSHDAGEMDPIAAELVEAGWLVWNVEYRRTGDDGGGWPQPLDDVRAALALLGERITEGAEPGDGDPAHEAWHAVREWLARTERSRREGAQR